MKYIKKYIKLLAVLNLSVQIFLLGISVFHIHNSFDIGHVETSLHQKSDQEKTIDPIRNDNGTCRIAEFVNSTYSSQATYIDIDVEPSNSAIISQSIDYFHFPSVKITSNSLRAPPLS